jgi:hypothetical protein
MDKSTIPDSPCAQGLNRGSTALPTYRIYHVGDGGRLRVGETFSAEDDRDAVVRARVQLLKGQPAELWEWGRPVGRFTREHEFVPEGG